MTTAVGSAAAGRSTVSVVVQQHVEEAPLLPYGRASQLQSDHPLYRWIGIAACAAHGVDPGPVLADGLQLLGAGLHGFALGF